MAELIDVTSPGQKKSYSLKDITILGRASTTDIKLDDLMVSRHHARVSKWNEGYILEDLGSLNGVFLNDERITTPQPLPDNSKICIGPHTLIFRSADSLHPACMSPPSSEYTQIIVATKDQVSAGTADEHLSENVGKEEFEKLQKKVKVFQKIAKAAGSIFDIDALLKEIIQIVFSLFPQAERCFIASQDDGKDTWSIRTIQTKNQAPAGEGYALSQTLARRAIEERRSLLIMNTHMDSEVSMSIKLIGASSILCAPLICP
ncbi:MAG: FHA domain-containing protein, partial [Candidatus Brocadia sp.]